MLACLLCHLMRLQINRGKLWMFMEDMQIMNEYKYTMKKEEKSNPLTPKKNTNQQT